MRSSIHWLATVVLVVSFPALALGISTKEWKSFGPKEFEKGTKDGVTINSAGEIVLVPKFDKVSTDEVAIWCSVTSSKGVTYFGTGKSGSVYKLEGRKVVPVLKDTGFMVTAMAADGNGNVYAASLPNGLIMRIGPDGKSQVLTKLPAVLYIWALACDSKGNVYAGTGPAGVLYRITPKGNPTVLYDTEADHIFSLQIDPKDNVYFGTAAGATLLRIGAADAGKERVKAAVVYDFDGNELKAIQIVGRDVYVAVNKTRKGPAEGVAAALYKAAGDDESSGVRAKPNGIGSVVYKIAEGRQPVPVYKLSNNFVTSMKVDAEQNLFLAVAAGKGVIRHSTKTGKTSSIEIKEKQVLTMDLKNGKLHIIGTSSPGAIYFHQPKAQEAASFTSRVFASGVPAKWGNVTWEATGKIKVEVRAGSTETPDETWTGWKEVAKPGASVALGKTSYVQYRATWSRKDKVNAELKRVVMSYLETNVAPKMGDVSIDKGTVDTTSSATGGAKVKAKRIHWSASDANHDRLGYRVYFRRTSEGNWKLLNPDELITETEYKIEVDMLPGGEYTFKVEATDEPSNTEQTAQTDEKESRPFLLDNSRPAVTVTKVDSAGAKATISGKVSDEVSIIKSIEYSVDGGKWTPALPTDDIFDGVTENFVLKVTVKQKGSHSIAIRATDAHGNAGVTQKAFQIK